MGRIHEPLTTKIIADNLNSKSVFFDLGAHIGFFSIVAAAICKRVECFEIDPKCVPIIKRNIKINGFKNISVNNVAISDREGKIKIPVLDNPRPMLSISGQNVQDKFIKVKSTDLDTFIKKNKIKPDLIKIDVEGAEYNVLRGMKKTLKKKNIKLLVEVHPGQLKNFGHTYHDVIRILRKSDYKIMHYRSHRSYVHKDFELIDKNSFIDRNTLFVATKD